MPVAIGQNTTFGARCAGAKPRVRLAGVVSLSTIINDLLNMLTALVMGSQQSFYACLILRVLRKLKIIVGPLWRNEFRPAFIMGIIT